MKFNGLVTSVSASIFVLLMVFNYIFDAKLLYLANYF